MPPSDATQVPPRRGFRMNAKQAQVTHAPPLPNSYWLPGNQVAAGEYPGDLGWDEPGARLERMLDAGIRSFVDLTEERDGLEPYDSLLGRLAAERGVDVRYARFGVRDMGVPSRELMAQVLAHIASEVREGRPVYVHCW